MSPPRPAWTRSALVAATAWAMAAGMLTGALPARAANAAPAAHATSAKPGRGPEHRPLPASAVANHGYPRGTRPPVVPPGLPPAGPARTLSGQDKARMPQPTASGTVAATAADTGATNLILRSGFDFNDTSLVLYFDAADPGISGWTSWKATVYDPSSGAAQDSRQMQPSDATVCQVPAKYCRSFGSADGWSLVGGHQYYVTITVTLADGTVVTSPASAQAAARTTTDPPPLPAAQLAGCSCTDALYPTGGRQQVRGSGVGTATGTYTATVPELRLGGYGVTFEATRRYSSANTTTGMLGIGWSWTYDVKVIPPASGQTSVTVRAEDGAQAVYSAGASGTYNRPPGVRSRLSTAGSGWKLVTPTQRTYTFDASGRLTSVVDKRGHGVTLAYGSGSITMTDAAGRVVTGTLSSAGLLTKLALPDKRNVIYKYTNGLLTSAQNAASKTWTYGYTNQLLTTAVDPRGLTQLTNTYSNGRVVKQVDASGAATTFGWDASKQEAATTDADGVVSYDGYRGNVLVYSQNGNGDTINRRYDQLVNRKLTVDAQGNQTVDSYDGASNILSSTAPDPFDFQATNTYDADNNVLTHTDGLGQVSAYGYTSTDELESILSPGGANTKRSYDSRGLLTSITDPHGKVTTFGYDAAGNLTSKTTPMGEVTTYTYDQSGRLLTRVDPRGNLSGARALDFTTTYTYDNLDRVTGVLAPRKAHPTTTTYDSVGQVTASTDPVGHQTTYTYGSVIGQVATVTDANAGVTTYGYTAAGRRSSTTDPAGGTTTTTYDKRGNVATVVSPRGNATGANPADFTTTYVYDFNGNLVRTSHPYPGGGTVDLDSVYDQLNRLTARVDAFGKSSTTGYDNDNRVVSAADPLGATTTYSYDKDGRPTAITAPAGGGTGTDYDAAGNVTKSTSAAGGVTTYSYDDDGRVATVTDPRGNVSGANPADYTIHYGYDAAGNLTTVTDQLGRDSRFAYDENSRVTAATDANGHATTYKYLDDDTVQSVVGPDGNTQLATTFSYDNLGNVTSRTDGVGNTRYTYDADSRVVDVKDPLNRDTLLRYDAEGNLTQTVAPGDTVEATRTITYSYDILNRLTRRDLAGQLAYTWGYDAKNQVTSLGDPSGVRSQGFDDAGRLTSVTRDGGSFGYGYDLDGNVTSRTWPDGTTVSGGYTADDRLSTLTVQGGSAGGTAATYSFGYDPSGRLSRTTYPAAGNLVTDRGYDRAGRLVDLNSHTDAGTVARYRIDRDPVGNPTGITTTRGVTSQHVAYTYDAFDRVTAACSGTDCTNPTGKVVYTYDEIGNRLSQTLSGSAGNSQTSYTYDSASELTGSTVTTPSGTSSTTYAYDRSGELVRAGNDTYSYNLDRTLASATVNGATTSYAYDAQGIQLSASTQLAGGGTQTRTRQTDINADLPRLATETTTSGGSSTTRGFLYAPGETPLGLLTGGQTDPFVPDTVAGVAAVLTPQGDTVAAYDYDPFGNARTDGTATGTPSVSNPVRFAGYYQDPTLGGMYTTPVRGYDPATGRFTAPDPITPPIRQVSVSPYAYVGDRALADRDPSGADPCSTGGAGCDVYAPSTGTYGPTSKPAPPPPTCSGATPEYCHAPGGNGDGWYDLFFKWVYHEIEGCDTNAACVTNEYFRGGDILVLDVRGLDSVDKSRAAIAAALPTGQTSGPANFHYGDMSPDKRRAAAKANFWSILSLGRYGMPTAQAFLGSYDMTWNVVGYEPDESPVVEFNLTNASDWASAKPDPGKVQHYGTGSSGDGHDAEPGEHWLRESFRWRETFQGGQAPQRPPLPDEYSYGTPDNCCVPGL